MIAHAWRLITGSPHADRAERGQPVLVACSGGGDSTALALALVAAGAQVTLAHVVHDMRPSVVADEDARFVERLAQRLGVQCIVKRIVARPSGGNYEAAARAARYFALAGAARESGLRFVATAHNSQDQIESVLMAMIRGSGMRGLAGIAPRKKIAPDVTLIRPMLAVSPVDARLLCRSCGVEWVEDTTNADTTRLRSAIRHNVIPPLLAIRPGVAERIAATAQACAMADRAIRKQATVLVRQGTTWERELLRTHEPAVLAAMLRMSAAKIVGKAVTDSIGQRQLMPAIRFIKSRSTDPRRFEWKTLRLTVTSQTVSLCRV